MRALLLLGSLFAIHPAQAGDSSLVTLKLYAGFITKLHCTGKLLVSAVGDEALVDLQPLPKELGCGVVLRPALGARGVKASSTNLILETSTVSKTYWIEVSHSKPARASDLTVTERGN